MSAAPQPQPWLSRLELGLVPTFACNLRCAHCFVTERAAQPHMRREAFLTLLRDAERLGVRSVQITGGEFFVYQHRLAALQHLAGLRIPVGISTNGTRVRRDDVAVLQGTRIGLCFSVDGPELIHDAMRGPGALARIKQAAAHCVHYGVRFEISSTVTRTSLPHVRETVRAAVEMGARAIHVSPIAQLGGRSTALAHEALDDDECIDLLAQLTALRERMPDGFGVVTRSLGLRSTTVTHPCAVCACWGEFCPSKKYWPTSLYVMPDGEVLPQSLHIHPRYSLGNAFQQGLAAVIEPYWGSETHQRFQALCRYVYQDLIYGADRPFFMWDELLREASALPPAELPAYQTVSHPYNHSDEIARARRRGDLANAEFPVRLG